MSRYSVLIATTDGPVLVQRLAEEDPDVRSVICLNGTSEALPISGAYDAFVRKPTGVIERLFGHTVYRMDVSDRVSDGRSWQLGVFAAHFLHNQGEMAERTEDATYVLWLTGEVNNDLDVGVVDHVAEKLERSAGMLLKLADQGAKVFLGYPKGNTDEVERVLVANQSLADAIFKAAPLKSTEDLAGALSLDTGVASLGSKRVEAGEKLPTLDKLRPGLVGFACVLTVVALGLLGWNVFGEVSRWRALAAGGAYDKLLRDMDAAKSGDCMTCRAAAAIYPVVAGLGQPGKGDMEMTASEIRAPDGRSCSSIRFAAPPEGRPVRTETEGRFAASPSKGLCGLVYRLRNTGSRPFHVWLSARPISGIQVRTRARRRAGTRHARLAPGETLDVRVRVPEWIRREVTFSVLALAGEAPVNAAARWAIRGAKNNSGGGQDTRQAILGLTARLMVHSIQLTGK